MPWKFLSVLEDYVPDLFIYMIISWLIVFEMHWILCALATIKLRIVSCNYFQHSPTSCLNETLFSMKTKNIDRTNSNQSDNTVTKVLLFGNFKNADAVNTLICYATNNYILTIKWLLPYLLISITEAINQLSKSRPL